MSCLVATGRPPTLCIRCGDIRHNLSAVRNSGGVDRIWAASLRGKRSQVLRRKQITWSEPDLAERAIGLASEALDADLPTILQNSAESAAETVSTAQGALQETAAAIGMTAAGKALTSLSGPVRAMVLLNLGSALFGSNQVAMKMTENSMSPDAISAIRFILAALCFLPGIIRGCKMPKLRNAGGELGLWLFGGYILQAIGLETTTAAHGSFTGTIMVLIVPLLVGLSGTKVPTKTWIAALIALLGVGLLTTSDATPNIGDGLCVLSAVLFGIQKWRSETATLQFREHTQELVAIQLGTLAAAAVIFETPKVFGLLTHHSPDQLMTMAAGLPWGLLIYMGLATTAFTLWVEINALKDISAPLAALIYTSEPLWGALFAWTLLGEHWGATGWLGAFLIVAASLAAQVNAESKETADNAQGASVEAYDASVNK